MKNVFCCNLLMSKFSKSFCTPAQQKHLNYAMRKKQCNMEKKKLQEKIHCSKGRKQTWQTQAMIKYQRRKSGLILSPRATQVPQQQHHHGCDLFILLPLQWLLGLHYDCPSRSPAEDSKDNEQMIKVAGPSFSSI